MPSFRLKFFYQRYLLKTNKWKRADPINSQEESVKTQDLLTTVTPFHHLLHKLIQQNRSPGGVATGLS
ncbi:hypothetical protein GCK32_018016 [Trichostrongylus colubriformis]|uniref:Uncharacterized protein n=1 Tax=Trichostrongylus colubriformis TaxID=6319 RepID=A0AAN8J1D8_TRICO